MSVKGLDTNLNVTKIVNQIKAKGYEFVIRYYSLKGNSKRMSEAESEAIANAGLKRVVVYQNKHNDYSKFNASTAEKDAKDALKQAKDLKQPPGIIYFAVDFDAKASQIEGNIKEHFKTLRDCLKSTGYSVGVYGSTLVCKKLKEAGLVSKTWVAKATGWGFNTSFKDCDIKQTPRTYVVIGGITFDENTAADINNIGAW